MATLSVSGVKFGELFTISGTGLHPDTQYTLKTGWPTGKAAQVGVTSDAAGAVSGEEYAYYHGTYTVSVWTAKGHAQEVASVVFTV